MASAPPAFARVSPISRPQVPKLNRRLVILGFLCLIGGFFVLLVPFGYNTYPCHPPDACIIAEPNPFAAVALESFVLAISALSPAFVFNRVSRVCGLIAVAGVLVAVFGTLLVWNASFAYGSQSIQYVSTSPVWTPVFKFGLTTLGAALITLGCTVVRDRKLVQAADLPHTPSPG